MKIVHETRIEYELGVLEEKYQACLSKSQQGIWYEMQKEKLLYEVNVYAKVEYLRNTERILALKQENWKEGKDYYPYSQDKIISIK